MLKRITVSLAMLAALSACTQLATRAPLELDLSVADPDRVRFSGKGAGAGMMLSSSMGAMGIAIGIAIDEGIGKDIHEPALAAGLDISGIVEAALKRAWQDKASQENNSGQNLKVAVARYGFISQAGEDDPAAPQLHLSIQAQDETPYEVKFPEDFSKSEIPLAPLEKLKTDGQLSIRLLEEAAALVAVEVLERTGESK